MSVSSSKELKF